MDLVPLHIRPHLIPFLFKELEGSEVLHLNKKVKACKVSSRSNLGFMIRTALQKTDKPVKCGHYYVYLALDDDFVDGKLYNVVNGKNSFLHVPEYQEKKINEILEDLFRMAFVYSTKGMLKNNKSLLVRDAIAEFMTEYQMDDYGFDLESVRRLLDRNSKYKLSRLQNQVSNRVLET